MFQGFQGFQGFHGERRRIRRIIGERAPRAAPIATRGRRARQALATTLTLWVALFLCAVLIAATISANAEHTQIEAQIQAAKAQNAAVQRDINTTQRALDLARSPAQIEREARQWGYRPHP
jgi:hypothetical protein